MAWEPAVGDWIQVAGMVSDLDGELVGCIGRVVRLARAHRYGVICAFPHWAHVHLARDEIRLATPEEVSRAQLASLEGL